MTMVVPRGCLEEVGLISDPSVLFYPAGDFNFLEAINKGCIYKERKEIEYDSNFKQPICYAVIINSARGEIFVYWRASEDEKYGEERLQGLISVGIGGHVDDKDRNKKDPIQSNLLRELGEEVTMDGKVLGIRPLGYINDESNDVGKVHFGILYVVETDSRVTQPKDPEIASGELVPLAKFREMLAGPEKERMESWTTIAALHAIAYLEEN